jgi:hypothetical protein
MIPVISGRRPDRTTPAESSALAGSFFAPVTSPRGAATTTRTTPDDERLAKRPAESSARSGRPISPALWPAWPTGYEPRSTHRQLYHTAPVSTTCRGLITAGQLPRSSPGRRRPARLCNGHAGCHTLRNAGRFWSRHARCCGSLWLSAPSVVRLVSVALPPLPTRGGRATLSIP